MGLLQLLAAGRSLGKIADEPSRYKMVQQGLLPKFGPVKALEERAPQVGAVGNQVIAKTGLKQSSLGFAGTANDRKKMNAVQLKPHEVTVPKTAAPKTAFPLGRWTLFKNPFSKSSRSKASEASVQSELSLDMVKPVRNDLSDADLELVQSVKRPPENHTPETAPAEPVVTPESASWSRIKTHFFGVGKA